MMYIGVLRVGWGGYRGWRGEEGKLVGRFVHLYCSLGSDDSHTWAELMYATTGVDFSMSMD